MVDRCHLDSWINKLNLNLVKNSSPLVGLEPTIPGLGGQCLLHQATEALAQEVVYFRICICVCIVQKVRVTTHSLLTIVWCKFDSELPNTIVAITHIAMYIMYVKSEGKATHLKVEDRNCVISEAEVYGGSTLQTLIAALQNFFIYNFCYMCAQYHRSNILTCGQY